MEEKRNLRAASVKHDLMRVGEIMNTKVVTVRPKEAASAVLSRMRRRGIRHLAVTQDGRLRGVISERDLAGVLDPDIRKSLVAEDLMTPRVVSVKPKTTLLQAADLMRRRQIGSVPVLDDGVLVGIVTASDVLDELGRSSTRSVFPGWIPRGLKRKSSRLGVSVVPAHIRVLGTKLSKDERIDIRQQLGRRLGKFGPSIERVTVRVDDVNGPRGGIDQLCRIKVVLSGLPSVVFEAQDASLDIAIGKALAGTERAVRRTVQRRRMKPIKVGACARAPSPDR
jgi:CBS domain-containing protein